MIYYLVNMLFDFASTSQHNVILREKDTTLK